MKTIKMTAALALLSAGSLAAGAAMADDRPGGRFAEMGGKMFSEADANSDGAVTAEEMAERLKLRFSEADADGDGFATRAEILGAIEKRAEGGRMARRAGAISDRMVERLDLDGDGKVALSEMENRARKHFALADWNDDGRVELAELRRMGPPNMRDGRPHGERGGWWRWRGAGE